MNIVYAADDNYVEIMAVSICSLLENNRKADEIIIYVLADHIRIENKNQLIALVCQYERTIQFIETENIEQKLGRTLSHDRSLAMYSRLFLSTALPESVGKVIYMDCDSLIFGSLEELYHQSLQGCCVAGVLDIVPKQYKKSVGIKDDKYINSGFLVINLCEWRERLIEERFIACIELFHGNVPHHDQGIINYVLHDSMRILSPEYNVLTPLYELNYKRLVYAYGLQNYYTESEILQAVRNPKFAHLVTSSSGRPWEHKNLHPLTKQYEYYKKKTQWKDQPLREGTKNKNVKIMKMIYQKCPNYVFFVIQKIIICRKNRRGSEKLNG